MNITVEEAFRISNYWNEQALQDNLNACIEILDGKKEPFAGCSMEFYHNWVEAIRRRLNVKTEPDICELIDQMS